MTLASKTIKYLRTCYEVDHRSNLITNVYNSKVSHRRFFKNGNFFTSWDELYLLEEKYAQDALKELQLYVKEKELKVGLFFLNFKTTVLGKEVNNVCPLIQFDAEIIQNEFYFLKIDPTSITINPGALKVIDEQSEENREKLKEQIEQLLQVAEGFDEAVALRVGKLFSASYPTLDTSDFSYFPKFITQKSLKIVPDEAKIRGAACMFIYEKTKNTQSVLDELETLEESGTEYSRLLLNYINNSFELPDENSSKNSFIRTPAHLSHPQSQIINSIDANQCQIVTGPPGTGKSYTIAAAAINEALKGKSILIVTGSEHANNAIEDKIKFEFDLKNISARVSKRRVYQSELNRNLKKWLEGVGLGRPNKVKGELEEKVKNIEQQLKELEEELFELTEDEIRLGQLIFDEKKGLINRIKAFFLKTSLNRIELHPKLINNYFYLSHELVRYKRAYIKAVQKENIRTSIQMNRETFIKFRKSLNATASGYIKELFDEIDFQVITDVIPIWISTVSDIGMGLPFKKEMFDLVIIDESSQIDCASITPIFQRAQKAIVCGDTEQLNPVIFLSKKDQSEIASKVGLPDLTSSFNYRDKSFLDICHSAVKDQRQVFFLDEHYRCLPDIINFSNQQFYNSELRIMTQLPHNKNKVGLEFIYADHIRLEDGTNEGEARMLVDKLKEVLIIYPSTNGEPNSIGVLSPFRKQIDLIEKMIRKEIDFEKIKRHRIICGTAHTFQGNERDIMLISFVVDDNAHHGAFMHANKSDVFNVSITRARIKQFVFHSLTLGCKYKDHLIHNYIFNQRSYLEEVNHDDYFEDLSLTSVTEWLKLSFKLQECEIDYVIAGINIDIWAKINNRYVGFDAIGFPGNYEAAINMNKLKILSRLGIKIIPISVSNFIYHKDELKSAITRSLK